MPSTFTLDSLKTTVGLNLITDTWVSEQESMGDFVAIYRDYHAGNHDADLTTEMKQLLRISREGNEFTGNYCQMVVDTMTDRLVVEKIEGDTDEATDWADELRRNIRFDELQIDIHESTIIDGQTFVMVWAEENPDGTKSLLIEHEPSFDGTEGMLAVYDRRGRTLMAAVKVWYEVDDSGEDITRVNVYRNDTIQKYQSRTGGSDLTLLEEVPNPVGKIPVVVFKNRAQRRSTAGISELKSVVPLQDGLNRTIVSMVSTNELTGFPIRIAKGFDPPQDLTPGMWVIIPLGELAGDADTQSRMLGVMEASVMEQSSPVPFIEAANFFINTISTMTRTPIPELMGSSTQSGEALKQREIGLLGKLRRFQVKTGNSWEDVMLLAQDVAAAFNIAGVPQSRRWNTTWQDIELRNDTETVENILKAREILGDEEALRQLSGVYNLEEKDIQRIEDQKAAQFGNLIGATFNQFENGIPEAA